MSSFFTLPASQKKRKRPQGDSAPRTQKKQPSKSRRSRDESISGSEDSDEDGPARLDAEEGEGEESDEEEFEGEDPAAKRIRLAEQYLANTEKEVLEDVGFDAADVDQENLRRRMGDRLKEDTAETKGKLYRWIAQDFDWSRAERAQFRWHQKSLTGVAISGRHAYTVGKDAVLVKWRLPEPLAEGEESKYPRPSRKPQRVVASRSFGKNTNSKNAEQHTKEILCVAASQDGKFVATGGADKKMIVWDAETLKPLKVFPQHRDSVVSLGFRRGTNQLFSASKDRTVKIWSLDELAYVETLFGHQDEVVDVSALVQEKCVSVGARDRTARLWKVVEESQLVFRGGGAPKKPRGHDADSGIDIMDDDPPHEGSTDRVACIDEETFVTGSDNGSLALWNIYKKKAVHIYPVAHGMDPPLPLEEVSAEMDPPEEARTKPTPRWITALRAIPFSDIFVSGSWDGYVRVWKVSSDKRRIESLGCLGATDQSVSELLERGLSNGDANGMQASKGTSHIEGIVNDLAIIDNGERAKDGVLVVAAVGQQHKLGRWKEIKAAKNIALFFEVPRRAASQDASSTTLDNDHVDGEGEFAGFD